MKKLLTVLTVMLVGISGLLFYGCSDRYADLSIEVRSVSELNADGVLVMYVGDEPQEVNITVKNAPDGFNYTPLISMTNPIVSVEEEMQINNNVVTKRIVALEPGNTVVSFITSEGDKRGSLKIKVIKRAESVTFKNQDNVAAIENKVGSSIKLGVGDITVLPQNSNQKDLVFSPVVPVNGIDLQTDGTLTITGAITTDFFKVKVTVVENGNPVMNGTNEVSAIGTVDIVKAMSSKLYMMGAVDKLISEDGMHGNIMLVKNMQELNTVRVKLDIETHGQNISVRYPTSSTEPVDVNLISVNDYNNGANRAYVFDVSAIRYAEGYELKFNVELSDYVGRFNDYGTTVSVTCDSLIRDFSVNNVVKAQDPQYYHDLDVYIGDSVGTTFKLKVADPVDIPTLNNKFFMELYKYNGSTYELVYDPTDMFDFWAKGTKLVHENGILGVTSGVGLGAISSSSGADIVVRVKSPDVTVIDDYMLKIVAERPTSEEKYQDLIDYYNDKYNDSKSVGSLRAYTQVKLNLLKGITSIDSFEYTFTEQGQALPDAGLTQTGPFTSVPLNINMDLTGKHAIEIFVGPLDASNKTIRAKSSASNILDVEVDYSGTNAVIVLYPHNVGSVVLSISSTTMLDGEYKTIILNVFRPIDNVFVGISSVDSGNIRNVIYNNIGGDKTLAEVTAQVNKTIRLEYYSSPAKAEIKSIDYEIFQYTKLTNGDINPASENQLSLSGGKYSFSETVQNVANVTVFEFNPLTKNFYIVASSSSDSTPYVYKILVKFVDYAGNEIMQEFLVRGYVPVKEIVLTATSEIIYNPEFLGYEDIMLGKHITQLQVTVLPSNATFKFNASAFDAFAVHEGGSSANSNMFSWVDLGLNRFQFSVNMGYTQSQDRLAYIVAKIDEFGIAKTGNIGIYVKNPVVVSGIAAENIIDNEIIFKMGLSQPFKPDITVLPINAFNSGVEFLQFINQGTVASPVWVRADENVNAQSRVFAINEGNIIPLRAGQARLVVVPKDKIKDADFSYDWDKVIDIFVDVTDGSAENPYYVSNLQELKDIGLSADTMDKYYVLTRDIAFGVLEPIGLSIDTTFTGGLSGKYTRTRGEQYFTNYNSIQSVVFSTVRSDIEYLGLFYRIGNNGDPQRGIVSDLTVEYQHIQATFEGTQIVFGGIAAISDGGTIRNVSVVYPSEGATGLAVNFITSEATPFIFGGIVGQNDGSIIIDDPQRVGTNGKISIQTNHVVNYIGGIAGMSTGKIIGLYSEIDESDIQINFGNAGYTSNLKIAAEAKGGVSVAGMGIGGIVGKNSGLLSGVASNSTITSDFNFVGGIAGKSVNGTEDIFDAEISAGAMLNVIKNSFSSGIVSGKDYVGGLVGLASSTYIYGSSAENYKSFGRTNLARSFVSGKDYVGGLVGSAEGANISYSYVVSYFEDSGSFDIVGVSVAGGLIGQMQSSVLDHVAVFANIEGGTAGAIAGSYLSGSVSYFMARTYGVSQLGGSGMSLSPTNGYYTLNDGAAVCLTYTDISAVELDTANWGVDALANDGLPYIKNKNGNILFATNPLSVDAIVGGLVGESNGTFTKTGDHSLVLFFSASTELTEKQLRAENNINMSSFVDVSIIPLTVRSSRVEVLSSNSAVISINQDGTLQLNGVGECVITISSRLNASFSVQLQVSVKYGINGFSLYKNANKTEADKLGADDASNIKTLDMLTNANQTIFYGTEFKKVIEGTVYNFVSTKEVGVRYMVWADDAVLAETRTQNGGVGIADIFKINNLSWQFRTASLPGEVSYWYVDVQLDSTSTIYALMKTETVLNYNGIRVYAQPFIIPHTTGGTEPVLIDLVAAFDLNIYNGATDIRFSASISSVTMTQLDTYILTVIMDTDADIDEIVLTPDVLRDEFGVPVNSQSSVSDIVVNTSKSEEIRDDSLNLVGKKKTYTITFVNKTTLIDKNRGYILQFSSSVNPAVKVSFNLTVKPQPIISADLSLYTQASVYSEEDGKSSVVYNEVPAIMELDVYPYFSLFDSFTITYVSDAGNNAMTIAQMAYDKVTSTFAPHPSHSATAIENGLRVLKQSGLDSPISSGDGKYSYSKMFYFSLLVANTSIVPDFSNFTVRITFYKDGAVVEPKDVTYKFANISEPIVTLDIADKNLNRAIPVGTKQELVVGIKNFDGEPEFSIDRIFREGNQNDMVSLSSLNLNSMMPTYENGKYYISIPSGTVTADSKSLAGTTIRYKAVATKEQNLKRETTLDVYVTEFTVTSIKVSNTEPVADRYKLTDAVIYETKDLVIELGVVTSDMSLSCSNGETVADNIKELTAEINRAGAGDLSLGGGLNDGVWWYYDNQGIKQPLYDNHSGELYNGVFMFRSTSKVDEGDRKAVYGQKVEVPTTIAIDVKFNYSGGRPSFITAGQSVNSGIRSRAFNFEFVLEFNYQTQLRNAMPINNAEELYAMESGKDYRLINDIYLPAHTPINTAVASFDGNGRTIYITGFALNSDTAGDVELGLFGTVSKDTLLMNVRVQYSSNVVNPKGVIKYYNLKYNTPYLVDELENATNTLITPEEYEKDSLRSKYYSVTVYQALDTSLDLTFNSLSTGKFGGIAAVNSGIITNCNVAGKIRIFTPSGMNILTSGGLVAVNDGYITNSSVVNFDIVTNGGNMGGVVGINNARISSTYSDSIRIENNSQNGFTGGFVYQNTATGVISQSFAQGKRIADDNSIRNSGGGIQSAISNSGFVYLNGGHISDSYANILLSHNSSLAGFVFNNQTNGVIDNCYATPTAALNTAGPGQANDASAFTGVLNGVVLNQGTITNCYYLDAGTEFTTFAGEKAVKLGTAEFSAMSSFASFNVAQNMDGDTGFDYAEGYTWFMAQGKPQLVWTLSPTTSEWIYKNREPVSNDTKVWDNGISVGNATNVGVYSASASGSQGSVELEYKNERSKIIKKDESGAPIIDENGLAVMEDKEPNANGWVALKVVSAKYGSGNGMMKNINVDLDINNNYDILVWVSVGAEDKPNPTDVKLVQYNVPEYVEYHYVEKTGAPTYGSKNNPRVVYSVESYNYEFNKVMNNNGTKQYVRFIANVDFNMAARSAVTALAENGVQGTVIEGNNMWVENIVLTYNSQTTTNRAFGLFSEFTDVIASDLNLSIIEIKSSSHYFVGGLVGFAKGDTYINNIVVRTYAGGNSGSNILTPYLVLGRNLVGGVVGLAVDNFRIENIDASINVSSTYILGGANSKYVYEPLSYDSNGKINSKTIEVSYAGAVVGALDASVINAAADGFGTVANAKNITVSGQTRVAGRTAGGIFGLIGKTSYVRDANYVLESGAVQYVHANNYGGGIVGENRGKITNSSIRYEDSVQAQIDSFVAQSSPSGGATGNRQFFTNGSVPVTAIGGLIGFNNDGIVLDCATSLDVRNNAALIAGGAVGRMMSGTIERVATSGSVLAGSIMGGLVGNIVSYNRAVKDAIGVFSEAQADQFGIVEDIENKIKLSPIIRDCVIATNYLNGDFNALKVSYDVARVVGGIFGTITTLGLDVPSTDGITTEDDVVQTDKITGNYYVNSIYNLTVPTAASAVAQTLYVGYQSSYLDMPNMRQAGGDVGRTYPDQMIVLNEWTNDGNPLTETNYDIGTGAYINLAGAGNVGLNHFELRRGNEAIYSEATGVKVDERDINSDSNNEFQYMFNKQFATNGDDINTENARLAADHYKSLMDKIFGGGNVAATDNPGNPVVVLEWECGVFEIQDSDGKTTGFEVRVKLWTDATLIGNTLKSVGTTFKPDAFNNFVSNIWNKTHMTFGDAAFMVLPSVIAHSQISVWTEFTLAVTPIGTEYRITTAEQLAWVAQQVNAGANNFSGKTVKLMNDIDLSGRYWVPIGTDSGHPFKGLFDGNGHSIKYATVDSNSLSVYGMPSSETVVLAGLFGYAGTNAAIQDLIVQGGVIRGYIAGGIVGYANDSVEVRNCENRSTVVGMFAAGGIVGYASTSCAINSVRNYGEIRLDNTNLQSSSFDNAAIYDKLSGAITITEANKIILLQLYAIPTELDSSKDYFIATVNLYVGGLAGKITSVDNWQVLEAGASKNYGRVSTYDTLTNYALGVVNINGVNHANHIRTNLYVGGLAGFAEGMSSNYGNYRVNYGSVSVASNAHILSVGGIFGGFENSSVLMAQNLGMVTVSYQNAQVTPNDSLTGQLIQAYQKSWASDFAVGGIVGRLKASTVELSGNFAKLDVSDVFSNYAIGGVGGVVGKVYPGSIVRTVFNTNTVKARAATQATTIGIGGVVGLAMGADINGSSSPAVIENSYNTGKVTSDNKAVLFMGGVAGTVIYEIVKSASRDVVLYNVGDPTNEFESALGSTNHFAYKKSDKVILQLENTYNAGGVSVDAGVSRNMLGGIVGYDSNIEFVKSQGGEPTNFYRTSSYTDAGAYRKMNDGGSGVIREVIDLIDPTRAVARTSEGLKLAVLNGELPTSEGWYKTVETWYPTLSNNDTELYWQDYREAFVAYEANVYYIYNAEQLAQLAYMVNSGRIDSKGLTFRLMNNIDLSNKYWTPIGTQNYPFEGIFDGNDYQINSLTVDGNKVGVTGAITHDGYKYGALFGFIEHATIKNVSLLGPAIFNVEYAAGLVVQATESAVEFVYTEQSKPDHPAVTGWGEIKASTVYFSATAKTSLIAAGIVARAINSAIENSYNNVPVTIVAPNSASYYDVFNSADERLAVSGGIVGILERNSDSADVLASLRNTYNSANGMVTNPLLNNTDVTDPAFDVNITNIMVLVGEIRYVDLNDAPESTTSKIIIENNYNVSKFADGDVINGTLLKVIDAVLSSDGTRMNYIHHDPDALKEISLSEVVGGLAETEGEQGFRFDFVEVWSGEYSLNEVNRYPSLRGLGEHWVNTESEPIALKNIYGQTKAEAGGDESEFRVYEISTAEELAWVAKGINNGTLNSLGYTFKLTSNIDLSGRYWTPIGTLNYPFRGVFDFDAKTVRNMIIDSSELSYAGLFGYVLGNSRNGNEGVAKTEIKNGLLENSFVKLNNNSTERVIYVGALMGRGVNANIRNIDITTNVHAIAAGTTEVYAGGVAGLLRYDYNQIVDGVTVSGFGEGIKFDDVTTSKLNEYHVDDNEEDLPYKNIGLSAVSLGGGVYAGGMAGWIIRNYPDADPFSNGEIVAGVRNVVTDINIFAMSQNLLTNITFDLYAGGIVGYSTAQVMSNVIANGSIKTFANIIDEEYAGGIVGYMVNTVLNNVYKNGGFIEGSKSLSNINSSYIGGIVACAKDSIMGFSVNTAHTGEDTDSVTLSKRSSGGIFGYAWADAGRGNTLETSMYDKDGDGVNETSVSHIYWKDTNDPTTFQKAFGYCLGVNADAAGENSIHIYNTNAFAAQELIDWGFEANGWRLVGDKLVLNIDRNININNLAGVNIFVGNASFGTEYSLGGIIEIGQYIFFVLTNEMEGNRDALYLNGVQVDDSSFYRVTVSGNIISGDAFGSDVAIRVEVTGYYDYEIVYRG